MSHEAVAHTHRACMYICRSPPFVFLDSHFPGRGSASPLHLRITQVRVCTSSRRRWIRKEPGVQAHDER